MGTVMMVRDKVPVRKHPVAALQLQQIAVDRGTPGHERGNLFLSIDYGAFETVHLVSSGTCSVCELYGMLSALVPGRRSLQPKR
jgi:hypothetical protein